MWAKTVCGTALHLRYAAITKGQFDPNDLDAERWIRAALRRESTNGMTVEFSRGLPNPEAMRRLLGNWLKVLHKHYSPRLSAYAELSFLLFDPQTGVWYEGDSDLVYSRGLSSALDVVWGIEDFKTQADDIENVLSPQHHLYSLAAAFGVWREAEHLTGVHQVDWRTGTGPILTFDWPDAFDYLWVSALANSSCPGLFGNEWWRKRGFATTGIGHAMQIADSMAYIRSLTADYRAGKLKKK